MADYTYICTNCEEKNSIDGDATIKLVSATYRMGDAPQTITRDCVLCNTPEATHRKLISSNGAFILHGSGFFSTSN